MFRFLNQTLGRFAPPVVKRWLARLESSPFGRRLAHGVFWSAVGAVLSRGLALISGIIAARLLGDIGFGELGMINSTIFMFATFATFGVGLTATKHVAELRKSDPERAGRIIAVSNLVAFCSGLLVALVMILMSPRISSRLLAAPHLSSMIALGSLALLLAVFHEAQVGTMSGLEAFKQRSVIQVIAGIGSFPIAVAGVWFFGLTGAVWGLVASNALLVLFSWRAIRKQCVLVGIPVRWSGLSKELGIVWRFNIPTLCCGAVYVPSMWIANMIVVNQPEGYAQMGVFSAADRWRTAIMFLPSLLGGVALPMLSSLSGNLAQFKRVLWTNVATSGAASFAVAAPIALFAPWIMGSYGPEFVSGKGVLVIMCLAAVLHAVYWILGQSLVSKGNVWTMFSLNVAWASFLLGTTWLLRHRGAQGLAFGYLFAEGIRLILGMSIAVKATQGSQAESVLPAKTFPKPAAQ